MICLCGLLIQRHGCSLGCHCLTTELSGMTYLGLPLAPPTTTGRVCSHRGSCGFRPWPLLDGLSCLHFLVLAGRLVLALLSLSFFAPVCGAAHPLEDRVPWDPESIILRVPAMFLGDIAFRGGPEPDPGPAPACLGCHGLAILGSAWNLRAGGT